MLLGTFKHLQAMEHMFTVVKHGQTVFGSTRGDASASTGAGAAKEGCRAEGLAEAKRHDFATNCFGLQKDSGSKSFEVIIRKYPRIFNNLQQTGNSHPRLSVISCDFTSLIYIARLEYETPHGRAAEQLPAGPVMAPRGLANTMVVPIWWFHEVS
jgi:hypothetical protein